MVFYIYDLETYPNCFLFNGKFDGMPEVQTFEISPRRNDRDRLLQWLSYLQNAQSTMVGFNSLQFDYPIIHELMVNPYTFDAAKAAHCAQTIIGSQNYGQVNPNHIRMQDRILPQIDLVKVNHFDNANKRTSLKSLQFAMRSESVEDLPFDPTRDLTSEQMDLLISYGIHDVMETEKFLGKCKHLIQMRQELLEHGVLSGDVLNYSDVKIGTEYLIRKIGRQKCFISGSNPRQTLRPSVDFKTIVLDKIRFRTEPFESVLQWFKSQCVYPGRKDQRPSLSANLGGLPFEFGLGGVHASVNNKIYQTNETHVIRDVDVSGMYVAVAIANDFAPEHLGRDFSVAYKQLQTDRSQYKKGTSMNKTLKLAGNGAYGNSNNQYSCFFDPKYTYSVTANGQLEVAQLSEMLALIPGLELIQANTDGITAYVPRNVNHLFDLWCNEWECLTGLKLEHVPYSNMWIRDVNNYVARTMDGKMKRKGAYWYPECDEDYEGVWNKDFSNLSAQKGVEQCLLNPSVRPADIVRLITDPFHFMCRYKTPAGAKLYIGGKEMLKTVRYYVSTAGAPMKKIATPKGTIGSYKRRNKLKDDYYFKILGEIPEGSWDERIHTKNKSKLAAVTTSVESGFLVKECNHVRDFNWRDVNYAYYENEIKKLLIGAQ